MSESKKCLFLDDERYPEQVSELTALNPSVVVKTRTWYDFRNALDNGPYDIYAFDWHLGEKQRLTGEDALQELIFTIENDDSWQNNKPIAIFHSSDPYMRNKMKNTWEKFAETINWKNGK